MVLIALSAQGHRGLHRAPLAPAGHPTAAAAAGLASQGPHLRLPAVGHHREGLTCPQRYQTLTMRKVNATHRGVQLHKLPGALLPQSPLHRLQGHREEKTGKMINLSQNWHRVYHLPWTLQITCGPYPTNLLTYEIKTSPCSPEMDAINIYIIYRPCKIGGCSLVLPDSMMLWRCWSENPWGSNGHLPRVACNRISTLFSICLRPPAGVQANRKATAWPAPACAGGLTLW